MRSPTVLLVVIAATLASAVRAQSPCFEDNQPMLMPALTASGMALGDIDGDGDLDLVVPYLHLVFPPVPVGFHVRRNLGDGSFAPAEPYLPADFVPTDVALSDFDGDGDLDAAFGNRPGTTNVVLSRNDGDGHFRTWTTLGLADGAIPFELAVGDLDGDGDPDIVTANYSRDTISVLRNDGNGVFAPHVDYAVGHLPRSVALGDLEGDGDLDVVVANYQGHTVSVFANFGNGVLAPPTTTPTVLGPTGCALGDIDGDGDLDLAVSSAFQNGICVQANVSGTFAPFVLYSTGFLTYDVAIADLDGDGDLDLVGACYDNVLAVFAHEGAGFAAPQLLATRAATLGVLCGDLDRDGDLDLVSRDSGDVGSLPSGVSTFRNCSVSGRAVCSGDGSATPCPCGPGGAGRGCPTSVEPLGARLSGSGRAQVGDDSLVLACEDATTSVVLFFQGSALIGGGAGAVFGDGLRCAGGTTIRLAAVMANGGDALYPSPGDAAVSVRGELPALGGTRAYQVWFRNAADFCTSATFNLTNGVVLAWAP